MTPNKLLAWMLSVLSAFALWNPQAQPNRIPETRTAPAVPADDGVFPTKEFAEGNPPLWFAPGLLKTALSLKGMMIGGSRTDGLLVLRQGKLIYEQYWNGYDQNKPHEMQSCTKSVISALVGIAIAEGKIKGVDQKVIEFFPEAEALLAKGQENKRDMTIEHLLTMTSGLPGDGKPLEFAPGIDELALRKTDCGLLIFLAKQTNPPGKKFSYSSNGVNLLAVLLAKATGKPLLDYAKEKLFDPLGITSAEWEQMPDGNYAGGGGLQLTPRDMARFGYLYLNYGRWEGRQIIPADWVAQTPPKSKSFKAYGRLFWNYSLEPFCGFYEANGAYGQYIVIEPSRGLVIVRTGCTGTVDQFFMNVGKTLGIG
ncbi:MAG: beta-lactamase family protein [Oscillospiraceae bacterium]|jgi:CubicO group peptidase (beta-lactamase class C family)|nr:beta-lactamase family protein [Oscillospiraceae bacterium]